MFPPFHLSAFSTLNVVPAPYRDLMRIPDLEPAMQFMRNPHLRKSQVADRESLVIAGGETDVAGWRTRIPPVM
jgi:hypothetical protein